VLGYCGFSSKFIPWHWNDWI